MFYLKEPSATCRQIMLKFRRYQKTVRINQSIKFLLSRSKIFEVYDCMIFLQLIKIRLLKIQIYSRPIELLHSVCDPQSCAIFPEILNCALYLKNVTLLCRFCVDKGTTTIYNTVPSLLFVLGQRMRISPVCV